MISITRVLMVLTLLGCFIVMTPHPSARAQESFSLAVGQWVAAGQYTLLFRGVIGRLPSYDLYIGSVLVAHFPLPSGGPQSGAEYAYGNVRIVTTGVTSDGAAATGTMTVQ